MRRRFGHRSTGAGAKSLAQDSRGEQEQNDFNNINYNHNNNYYNHNNNYYINDKYNNFIKIEAYAS